jgi:CRISPR-associated endoribonuclease Cas6
VRIRIVFAVKNRGGFVPFHHQHILAQTIKGVLASGGNLHYASSTDFNFSGLKGQTKISRKGLHFYSAKVTLVFSSGDPAFLDYFSKALFNQREFMLGNLTLIPESAEPETPVVMGDSNKFLCISPIVILPGAFNDDVSKRFISPEEDEFSDLLYDSTMQRMAASGRFNQEQLADFYKFQIVPDKGYLERIQTEHKKFARIYPLFDHDIKYEVRGYTFPFTLYAPKAVQHFIYESGLGHFAHKGFGMLDVAHSTAISTKADKEFVYA